MRAPLYRRQPPRHRPAVRVVFGPAGEVTGDLTGSTTLTFTPAGALTGTGVLAGSAAMAFTAAGELTDANAPEEEAGGVGGDRGIDLRGPIEEEKPRPRRVPQADFAARFIQNRNTFKGELQVESEIELGWIGVPLDFEGGGEVESDFAFESVQQSVLLAELAVVGVHQRPVPVMALHQPVRTQVEFECVAGDISAAMEIEA